MKLFTATFVYLVSQYAYHLMSIITEYTVPNVPRPTTSLISNYFYKAEVSDFCFVFLLFF